MELYWHSTGYPSINKAKRTEQKKEGIGFDRVHIILFKWTNGRTSRRWYFKTISYPVLSLFPRSFVQSRYQRRYLGTWSRNNLTGNNQLALTSRGPHQMRFYIISSLTSAVFVIILKGGLPTLNLIFLGLGRKRIACRLGNYSSLRTRMNLVPCIGYHTGEFGYSFDR